MIALADDFTGCWFYSLTAVSIPSTTSISSKKIWKVNMLKCKDKQQPISKFIQNLYKQYKRHVDEYVRVCVTGNNVFHMATKLIGASTVLFSWCTIVIKINFACIALEEVKCNILCFISTVRPILIHWLWLGIVCLLDLKIEFTMGNQSTRDAYAS
jgi:hypothetical protein